MLDNNQQQFTLEMTVVSAQGLKNTSSFLFTHRLRPFITITTFPPPLEAADLKSCRGFQTRVDDQGGVNPTWGDKFHVPIHHTFFANRYSCIYLQLFTKRLISGKAQLGWCQIPAADIGLPPVGSVRQLSYRLREADGTRTHGVVNVAVKLEVHSNDRCRTVIGVPVRVMPLGREVGSSWKESEDLTSGGTVGTGGDCADAMVKWQGLR
ncbi:hypothetical protein Godav_021612 [Gossypium davidsonii]|uniref:C2 domain-containing protein n=2 Tax=Gossypium TaxID=3633 RepID=A0A7J8R7K5_GOSDV|nr:hypothetical protein [Gossypium davidsonii]MBA0644628.1 hypothetical protein [Gossypium klotzschianum]